MPSSKKLCNKFSIAVSILFLLIMSFHNPTESIIVSIVFWGQYAATRCIAKSKIERIYKKLLYTAPACLICVLIVYIKGDRFMLDPVGDQYFLCFLVFFILAAINIFDSISIIKTPELLEFIRPNAIKYSFEEITYLSLASVSEEFMYRALPFVLFGFGVDFILVSLFLFLASHYILPWQNNFDLIKLIVRSGMSGLLTFSFIYNGFLITLMFHFLFNFLASTPYVLYLWKTRIHWFGKFFNA